MHVAVALKREPIRCVVSRVQQRTVEQSIDNPVPQFVKDCGQVPGSLAVSACRSVLFKLSICQCLKFGRDRRCVLTSVTADRRVVADVPIPRIRRERLLQCTGEQVSDVLRTTGRERNCAGCPYHIPEAHHEARVAVCDEPVHQIWKISSSSKFPRVQQRTVE